MRLSSTWGRWGRREYPLGGAQVNSIPKSGGNRFSGSVFLGGTNSDLQSNNLDDDLRNQGLTSINSVKKVYDVNGAVGGPLLRERLWFFASARRWGTTTGVANLYADANTTDFLYTPDLSEPIEPEETDKAVGGRVTFQAIVQGQVHVLVGQAAQLPGSAHRTARDRDHQERSQPGLLPAAPGRARHAGAGPVVEPALRRRRHRQQVQLQSFGTDLCLSDYEGCGGQLVTNVSINDVGLGYTYNGVARREGLDLSHQSNGRFNVSFVNSRHSIKTGVFWMYGLGGGQRAYNVRAPEQVNGLPVTYTFLNGRPTQLTQFVSPNLQVDQLNPDLGLYVQDQWRLNRLTVSAGLRFEWLRESVAASSSLRQRAGTRRSPSRPSRTCRTGRTSARGSASCGIPMGDAKTAIKFGINRYVQFGHDRHREPVRSVRPGNSLGSTGRTWNDANLNFLPDCDLTARTANGECGAMLNANFGTNIPSYRPDADWVNGWEKRPYNWQTSVTIDRELLPYLVVNAGYYRTWYGNFMVTDNQRVAPDGLQPLLRDRPDRHAPRLSGQQLCGLYDLNPNRVGQIDNLRDKCGELRQSARGVQRRGRELPVASAGREPRSVAGGTSATPCSWARWPAATPRPAPTAAT